MGLGGGAGLESVDEWAGLVGTAADDAGGLGVELTEVAEGVEVIGVGFDSALEGLAYFFAERVAADGAGVGGFLAVGAGEPHEIHAVVGRGGDGSFALGDGLLGLILGVEDATEKLVSVRIVRCGGKGGVKGLFGLVDAAVLQGGEGLRGVCMEERGRGEQEAKQHAADERTRGHHCSMVWTSRPLVRSRLVVALSATTSFSARPEVISTCVRLVTPTVMGVLTRWLLTTL